MKVITLKQAIKRMDREKNLAKFREFLEASDEPIGVVFKDPKSMIEDYQKIFKHDRVTWVSRPYKPYKY